MAIAVSFSLVLPMFAVINIIELRFLWGLLDTGAGISLLGFLDDHKPIAVPWRLFGHFAGVIWALFWLGGLLSLSFFGFTLDLDWIGYALVAVYLVWLLNLYNFMDGIDDIASVEAICVCLGGALLYGLTDSQGTMAVPLLLAVAVAGFLFWNFSVRAYLHGGCG